MFVILGATGKVGLATIRELRGLGAPVRAVVRDPSRAGELGALGCEIAMADLRDAAALKAAVDGARAVQVICPTRAIGESGRKGDAALEMRAIIDAIVVALASARPAATLAISDYGAELSAGTGITLTFHYLETRLRTIDTSLTLLRSAEHMENWAALVETALKRGALPSLHQPVTKLFPTVSARDVGFVAADLLATPGIQETPRIVHVEGPRRYSAMDVARMLSDIVEREILAREVPRSAWISALVGGGLSASYAELVAEMFDAHNAGLIEAEHGAGEVRQGTTELSDVLASLARRV